MGRKGGTEGRREHRLKCGIFWLYVCILLRLIVFKYPWEQMRETMRTWQRGVILEGLDTANFTLFATIRMYVKYADRLNSFENLAGNVLLFLPLGFLLPWVWRGMRRWRRTLAAAFLCSAGIELFQLFSAFGAFDVDDLLLNCAGAMLGFGLWHSCGRVRLNACR